MTITPSAADVMAQIRHAVGGRRYDLASELRLHAEMEADLAACAPRLVVEREAPLGRGRIDFLVRHDGWDLSPGSPGVGIEVKRQASRKAILGQLERYAGNDRIIALVLVTATAMALPVNINRKPVTGVSLGAGFL